ncbi:MAG: biopolymer transporter ExbD [Bdellovibrionales bacterium]|nr:biopolymer transporter ExbD [Bdellovibrionales bacterium]
MARGWRRDAESTFELNLAPLLDMTVVLIPALLLASVFVKITVVESPLPQPSTQTQPADQKKDAEVSLKVEMSAKGGHKLTIQEKTGNTIKDFPLINGKLDFEGLYAELYKTKQRYPSVFKIELMPNTDVAFNDIILTMDAVRNRKMKDEPIEWTDPKTGQLLKLDQLFPDVVLANVLEG